MISDREILNIIKVEAANTIGTSDSNSELGKQRSDSINYYHGKMDDMPALPGWSRVTTRDVFQTIESAMPDLLEIFASNEEVMEFLPEDEADVEKANQETDVVNYVFYQENHGFLILYTFIKDALQTKNGFVRAEWESRQLDEEEDYINLDDDTLAVMRDDDEIEIIDIETTSEKTGEFENIIVDGKIEQGEEIVIRSHNITIVNSKDVSGVKVESLPPENVAISSEAVSLQEATLVRYETKEVTRSDLIELGIPKEKVARLKRVGDTDNSEELARNTLSETDEAGSGDNKAQEKVAVADNYIRLDMHGTGRSQLWHVMTGDNDSVLLSKDRITRCPISTMTPIIEPHKLFGISLADLVVDLQRINTFFTRAAIDNAAALNNQRPIISEQSLADSTIDDILTNRPSSPILVRGDARAALTYAPNNNIAPDMVGLIQYFDSVKVERTGITRFGQDMDPNAIRKDISATEFAGQRSDALKTIKLIARIFAETGLKDMMINIHHALQTHSGNKERAFRINNKFVDVNPLEWKRRSDMQVNIGLGTGTKAEQTQQLLGILEQQKIAWAEQGGQDGPLIDLERIRHTLARITELQGFKTADAFWKEIDPNAKPQEKPEPAPDPALVKVQMDAQNDAQKNQIDQQKNLMNAQITQQKNEDDLQVKIFQITQELSLKAEGQRAETELKEAVAIFTAKMAEEKLDLQIESAGINMGINAAKDLDSISTNITRTVEVGGDAG